MKPLPIRLKGAALGLAALMSLTSAAALHAVTARNHSAPALPATDTDVGCELNPRRLC